MDEHESVMEEKQNCDNVIDPPFTFKLGLASGLIIGIFLGLVVFGIAIVGQGLWSDGVKTGRFLCEMEHNRKNESQ